MPKIPRVSGADAVRAFEQAGWRRDRQRGSHVILLKAWNGRESFGAPASRIGAGNFEGINPKFRYDGG